MFQRFRRLRSSEALRSLCADVHISVKQLVMPYFITEGTGVKKPIPSLPGLYYHSADTFLTEAEELASLGINNILLFGVGGRKDAEGSGAWDARGPVPSAIKIIKKHLPQMCIIADVCLCSYTDSGHCGIYRQGLIQNDETLPLLQRAALCYAQAGADIIAPSDMMDGRVLALRQALNENNFAHTPIMAYSSKFASAYYGPFRDAAGSAPSQGDRKSYQMDFRRKKEALEKSKADISEGADILMVKPALAYLDILYRIALEAPCPLAVYNVSGEYAMVKAASQSGLIDEKNIVLENFHAFVRAGADIIISYHSKDAAGWIKNGY